MNVKGYIAIRRAFSLYRSAMGPASRITFDEYALMTHLALSEEPLRATDLARYQNVLRPTMTHRTSHLADKGLIKREDGTVDRRNVMCALTKGGRDFLAESSKDMVVTLHEGGSLSQVEPPRFLAYVHTMGAAQVSSLDMCLLGVHVLSGQEDTRTSVVNLVGLLGLLQPTVSMSLKTLVERGLLEREGTTVHLTDEGQAKVDALLRTISKLTVPHGLYVS